MPGAGAVPAGNTRAYAYTEARQKKDSEPKNMRALIVTAPM